MPRMTPRWRNAAVILAILAFAAIAVRLVTRQQVFVPGATSCSAAASIGGCFQAVPIEVVPTLVSATINGLIAFGLVYVVFLVVRAVRG